MNLLYPHLQHWTQKATQHVRCGHWLEMGTVMMKPTLLNVDTILRIVATWTVTEVFVRIAFVTFQKWKKSYLMRSLTKIATWNKFGLGDKICDLSLNNEENYFDVGDCCLENPKCMLFAFDRNYVECPENSCIQSNTFCVLEEIGDEICQDHNNGPFCQYDLGDCCLAPGNFTSYCCNCQYKKENFAYDYDGFLPTLTQMKILVFWIITRFLLTFKIFMPKF